MIENSYEEFFDIEAKIDECEKRFESQLNKDVIKIHTGFNGPATGEKYIEFINEFDNTIRFMQGN